MVVSGRRVLTAEGADVYFRPVGNAIQAIPIMCHSGIWANFTERARLYAASGTFSIAFFILWLARRLYRAELLIFSDLRYALRAGERLRRLGSRLVRWKHH